VNDWIAPSGRGRVRTPRSTSPAANRKPIESPRCTGRCRFSTSCSAPVWDDTGNGADSTTAMPRLSSPAARSTAIRGCSAPAIRFACTLAATSTPSSGASTVAPRRANCRKPMLVPAGQATHA
jgi:hypothetical protein